MGRVVNCQDSTTGDPVDIPPKDMSESRFNSFRVPNTRKIHFFRNPRGKSPLDESSES